MRYKSMDSLELLNKYVNFNESALASFRTPEREVRDAIFEFEISEWNFTSAFFMEWRLPESHDAARRKIADLFSGSRLVLICRNVAYLAVDRMKGRPSQLLARVPPPATPQAYLGPITVFGSVFKRESELLERLEEAKSHFFHWTLHLTDARFDIVAEEVELPNFPRGT